MADVAMTGDPQHPAIAAAVAAFHELNYSVELFPTNGRGLEMERRIREREFGFAFDFSPVELLTGTAGTDRLTAAGAVRVPQLISVCGLDFHSAANRPSTPEERDALGKVIVERACAATGPTLIALPLKGFQGEGPDDPLFQSIRSWVYPPNLLVEFDLALDEPKFGVECVHALIGMVFNRTKCPEKP